MFAERFVSVLVLAIRCRSGPDRGSFHGCLAQSERHFQSRFRVRSQSSESQSLQDFPEEHIPIVPAVLRHNFAEECGEFPGGYLVERSRAELPGANLRLLGQSVGAVLDTGLVGWVALFDPTLSYRLLYRRIQSFGELLTDALPAGCLDVGGLQSLSEDRSLGRYDLDDAVDQFASRGVIGVDYVSSELGIGVELVVP